MKSNDLIAKGWGQIATLPSSVAGHGGAFIAGERPSLAAMICMENDSSLELVLELLRRSSVNIDVYLMVVGEVSEREVEEYSARFRSRLAAPISVAGSFGIFLVELINSVNLDDYDFGIKIHLGGDEKDERLLGLIDGLLFSISSLIDVPSQVGLLMPRGAAIDSTPSLELNKKYFWYLAAQLGFHDAKVFFELTDAPVVAFGQSVLKVLRRMRLSRGDFGSCASGGNGTLANAVELILFFIGQTKGLAKLEFAPVGNQSYLQLRRNQLLIAGRGDLVLRSPETAFFVSIVILVERLCGSARLDRTLRSISRQSRRPNSIHLIERVGDISFVRYGEDWVLFLREGDRLDSSALDVFDVHLRSKELSADSCVIYFDHEEIVDGMVLPSAFHKPSFNFDLLLSTQYIGRSLLVNAKWASGVKFSGAVLKSESLLVLVYFLALRASCVSKIAVTHLPVKLLFQDSLFEGTFVKTSEVWSALGAVLVDYLRECGDLSEVSQGPAPGTFNLTPPLRVSPKVSIVIPSRDQLPFLSRCIESILDKTDYHDFEILVVDNDSQMQEAKAFLSGLELVDPDRIRVLRVPGPFNFSRMNNLAVAQASGEFILLLNNDTAALHADWLSHMMRHALREGVGIVGARLLYPEGTVQHAGVIMGLRGPAEHPCLGLKADEPGYMFRAQLTQNFSAVTGACMLVSKAVYEEVGGLDEDVFAVSYNDVDFCLRVGKTGRRIVWTPLATLLHEGSASQKADIENIAKEKKAKRFTREQAAMYERWPEVIANDPAYNPNLSLVERGYEVETNPLLCYDPLKGLVEHRVVAFAADAFGCGNYRILQPMQAMLDAGLCSGGASPELFGPNLALRSGADTLVFQRPSNDGDLALLESLLPLKKIKKVYEVDDDLSRVPMKSAHREHMPKDIRARMIRNIGLCDRLVVSTDTLAHQLRGSNDDIRVVLNRLPPAMWGDAPPVKQVSEPAANKPRVGWAGGISHQGDLELIAQVVRDTADQVDWVFFGMCPEVIRPYVKEFYAGVPTLEYPKRLMELAQSWDLAVAPLEINPFNESKSNLRLLEYGWCGLPVVCSDITPYQGDLPVRRVKNRYKDWRAAILEAVSEREASRQMGQALQQRVHSDWMLKGDNLTAWYEAWTGK